MIKCEKKWGRLLALFTTAVLFAVQTPLQVVANSTQGTLEVELDDSDYQRSTMSDNIVSGGNAGNEEENQSGDSEKLKSDSTTETMSGQCGDNLTWVIEGDALTISGTGDMWDYLLRSDSTGVTYSTAPWWEYRESLTKLNIEDGVTSIGGNAFWYGYKFTGSLKIPDSVTTIGFNAFQLCSGFTDLTLSEALQSIGDLAFWLCSGFSGNLTLPKSLRNIGYGAFEGCDGFTGDLIIPDNVWSISVGAFKNCSGFDGSLLINNDNMTAIGANAFYGCSGLTGTVVIPGAVKSIGNGAFGDCNNLAEIRLAGKVPSDVVFLESLPVGIRVCYPTLYQEEWESVAQKNDSINWNSYTMSGQCGDNLIWTIDDGALTISGTGDMWDYALGAGYTNTPWRHQRKDLTKLQIGQEVTYIGAWSFYGCAFTGELTIPEKVTGIGESAFYGCAGLTGSLVLPEGISIIEDWAFADCWSLTGNLIIPQGVTSIGDYSFLGCSGFTGELNLPEGVTSVGQSAFYGCTGLYGKLTIPDSMIHIGGGAFGECSGLQGKLNIPEGVISIGDHAFWLCSGFESSLIIPDSVESIGIQAFYGCTGLNAIYLPDGIKTIKIFAFDECTGLRGLYFEGDTLSDVEFLDTVPAGVNIYYPIYRSGWDTVVQEYSSINWIPYDGWCGDALIWSMEETALTISGTGAMDDYGMDTYGLRSVSESAPWADSMNELTELRLSDGITHIGSYAFYGAEALDGSVTIPESVESIGNDAFGGCTGLDEVHFEGDAMEDVSFLDDLSEKIAVYYPAERTGWNDVIKANEHINWIAEAMGAISGAVQSYGEETNPVTIRLMQGAEEVAKAETMDGAYLFDGISEGTYTLEISKDAHVTRSYEVTVDGSETVQNVEIRLIGDITGDGIVNTRDWNRMYAHINETNLLTGYELSCADVMNSDGNVNVRDWNRLYAHINETNLLW